MSSSSDSQAILSRFTHPGFSLSPAIAKAARRSLGVIAAALFIMTTVGYLLTHFVAIYEAPQLDSLARQIITAIALSMDLLLIFLVNRKSLDDSQVLNFAYVYQVLRAGTLALTPMPTAGNISISWALILVVLFPMLLPSDGRRSIVATILAGLTQPIALLCIHVFDESLPAFQLIYSAFSGGIAVVTSLLGADLVRRYQNDSPRDLGSYELKHKLGAGGMGEVWAATHLFLSRPAAIKLIPRKDEPASSAQKKVRRFRREAQVTSNLTSPHTVGVFDYGITNAGAYYYVMEYLDGLDLQQLIRRDGPLPVGRAVHLLDQTCDSVGEAHEAGLIHRDLKPGNLFLVRRGLRYDYVKVLDFGLVGLQSALSNQTIDTNITAQGMMTGTPAYMSPEMVKGDAIDGRADIYALGCVLYFLVTGQLVFPELRGLQMAMAHAHEDPRAPNLQPKYEIPDDLNLLIMMCLAKSPLDRPQSALELRQLLRELDCYKSWTDKDAQNWWDTYQQDSAQERMREAVRRGEQVIAGPVLDTEDDTEADTVELS